MEKYARVEKEQGPEELIGENEVRITQQGKTRLYISYATTLFEVCAQKQIRLLLTLTPIASRCRRRARAAWCSKQWVVQSTKL
jgi:hypothetical protein